MFLRLRCHHHHPHQLRLRRRILCHGISSSLVVIFNHCRLSYFLHWIFGLFVDLPFHLSRLGIIGGLSNHQENVQGGRICSEKRRGKESNQCSVDRQIDISELEIDFSIYIFIYQLYQIFRLTIDHESEHIIFMNLETKCFSSVQFF